MTLPQSGFDWKDLKQDAVIVDAGGRIGAQSMTLARNYSHLRFVVQDREQVVKDAVQVRLLCTHSLAGSSFFRSEMANRPAPKSQRVVLQGE